MKRLLALLPALALLSSVAASADSFEFRNDPAAYRLPSKVIASCDARGICRDSRGELLPSDFKFDSRGVAMLASLSTSAHLLDQAALSQAPDDAPASPVPAAVPTNTAQAIIGSVLALVIPLVWKFLSDHLKEKAAARLAMIRGMALTVYWATEEAKRLWPDKVPDTAEYAERKLIEELAKLGADPASPNELAMVKLLWAGLHGQTKVAAEMSPAAAAAPPSGP